MFNFSILKVYRCSYGGILSRGCISGDNVPNCFFSRLSVFVIRLMNHSYMLLSIVLTSSGAVSSLMVSLSALVFYRSLWCSNCSVRPWNDYAMLSLVSSSRFVSLGGCRYSIALSVSGSFVIIFLLITFWLYRLQLNFRNDR